MRSCFFFFTRKPAIQEENHLDFSHVRQKMESIKFLFGVTEDGFIGQALFYFFQRICYYDCDFTSGYWAGRRQDFAFADLQVNDLTSAGHPGFSAIDYPHQLKARDKYKLEEKVYGVTGWQVTLSENAITMSNQGLLRILFRVEFLLEKNLYNYQHTAVINILKRIANVNPMREIDNEALATKFTTIFFETLESIYAKYYLDKFKAALILSLTDIKTALKDLPLPLLMIIFEYTPLINSDIRSLDLPRLAPRNPVKFSFSSVGGLHYGEYLVIQGHLKNPDEIVKIFNRIVPNSAKAFPETSKIYIANKALMHPMFVGSYKDAVRLYHPSACTAFTFVEHLVSSRRIRSC